MRTSLYNLLSSWQPFTDLVAADRIYMASRNGLDATPVPAVEEGRWAALALQEVNPGIGNVYEVHATLDVYDRPGSYLAVDAALKAAEIAMRNTPFRHTPTGEVLQDAVWEGISEDRYEEDYRAIYRQATWRLIGTQRVSG